VLPTQYGMEAFVVVSDEKTFSSEQAYINVWPGTVQNEEGKAVARCWTWPTNQTRRAQMCCTGGGH
jgi:hypothetical protein